MARAGLTPDRIALVGAAIADESGFSAVTPAEVARRVGVQTASLYSHVAGTAALRQSVTLLALDELADRVDAAVAGRARKDALAGLANAYRDYAHEHPGRFEATLARLDPAAAATSAGPRHARLAEAVLRGYGLDTAQHTHAVRLLGSTVRGFLTLEAGGGFDHSAPPPAESWDHVIDALDQLLTGWSASSAHPLPQTRTTMTSPTLTPVPLTEAIVRGAADLEQTEHGVRPHRLPARARAQTPDPQLALVEAQPSGVRLVFRTSATVVELDVLRTRTTYTGVPARPDGIVDLVVDGDVVAHEATSGGTTVTVALPSGTPSVETLPPATIRFDGLDDRPKDVEVWLPHNESLELVALRTDAPVEAGAAPARPVWVHHGSSISHGSNATRPTGTWPAVAARQAGVELVNLGLGGSALLDPFTARTIRDTPADLISLKLGINVVNLDLMRRRAFGPAVHGFLDTIREGHPTTPLLVVSPIFCAIHEDTPGPGAFDLEALAEGRLTFLAAGDPADVATGRLSLTVVREELERIVRERQATDPHLTYLDGRELYSEPDAAVHPLPDAIHPDAATHQIMGERFAEAGFALLRR